MRANGSPSVCILRSHRDVEANKVIYYHKPRERVFERRNVPARDGVAGGLRERVMQA